MFAVILCSGCGNPRLIDLGTSSSKCPRCGKSAEHRRAKIHLRSEDQTELRAAMWSLNSTPDFIKDSKPKKTTSTDPVLRLQREMERCHDPEQRLVMAAEALSSSKGYFTKQDLEAVFPTEAEAMISTMVAAGIVFEPRPGRYQRI